MYIKKVNVAETAATIGLTGKVLAFRPFAKQVREMIFNKIEPLMPGDVIELDFSNVELCDLSFADELILEAQLYVKTKRDLLLYISNVSEDVLINLEGALRLREAKKSRIPILRQKDGSFEIIGSLEENLLYAFKLLTERHKLTARELKEIEDIAINNASNKLKKLYDLGLVMRIEDKEHIYRLPGK